MEPSDGLHDVTRSRSVGSRVRDDLSVIGGRTLTKLRRLVATAPIYLPSRHPVGRQLRNASALDDLSGKSSIEHREVFPTRRVARGADTPIDVPALLAFAITPGQLLTDGSLFRGALTCDGRILSEISVDHRSRAGDWRSFRHLQRLPPVIETGSAVSLLTGAGGAENFGHWLYDVLPRLHLAERAGLGRQGDRYLVPPIDREYKETTLRLLGIERDDCIEVGGPTLVDAERLVVTGGHRNHGRIEPWIPQFLRERLMQPQPQDGRRLYINRRDTKLRRITNEAQLESALAVRGFESVSMSDFDFAAKVGLYASAEAIVAPHGSGLAGLAFCEPGTKVIELTGGEWFNPWFEDIAAGVHLDYRAVPAATTVSPGFLPDIVRHIDIDVDRVIDAVDTMLG
jgi:hypothetical protein